MITPCFYLDTHMVPRTDNSTWAFPDEEGWSGRGSRFFSQFFLATTQCKTCREEQENIFSSTRNFLVLQPFPSYVYFKRCSNNFLHWAIWNNVAIVENKINDVFLETFPISLFPRDPELWTWVFRLSFPKVTDVAFRGNPLTWILL